jgi:hypothetical protein
MRVRGISGKIPRHLVVTRTTRIMTDDSLVGSWSALGGGLSNGASLAQVYALTRDSSGNLVVGGAFTSAGGVPANNIARWNGAGWTPLGSGMNGAVLALAMHNGMLYAGGRFSSAGGSTVGNVARWNGSAWEPVGPGVGFTGGGAMLPDPQVNALISWNGMLVAGGTFTGVDGSPCERLAIYNGSSWSELGGGVNNTVAALAVWQSDLVVGGAFTTAGPGSASRLAVWNGSTWSGLGSGFDNTVFALAASGSELTAGGFFTASGATQVRAIGRWTGTAWQEVAGGINSSVYSLGYRGAELVAGGLYSLAGSTAANSIAFLQGTTWKRLGSGMNLSVYAVEVSAEEIIAGGFFTQAGGQNIPALAVWRESQPLTLNAGWNMVSLPRVPADRSPSVVFAGVSPGTIYGYSGLSYVAPALLEPGQGYWAYYDNPATISIAGATFDSAGVIMTTAPGWALLGSLSIAVPVASIRSDPPGAIAPGTIYGYQSSGYYNPSTITPGMGVWVYLNSPTVLYLKP